MIVLPYNFLHSSSAETNEPNSLYFDDYALFCLCIYEFNYLLYLENKICLHYFTLIMGDTSEQLYTVPV